MNRKYGGLGVKDVLLWNKAAIGKYVWAIATKKDSLFVKWVNGIYLIGKDWWQYEGSMDSSWYWRKLVALRNDFKGKLSQTEFCSEKYTITRGCRILGENSGLRVQWCSMIWSRLVIPKHRFIGWLVMQNRLQTRGKLYQIGVISDDTCLLCGCDIETVSHLFFECSYSDKCMQKVKAKLDWHYNGKQLEEILRWFKHENFNRMKKQVIQSLLLACIYHIWRVRNDALWSEKVWTVDNTVNRIVKDFQLRLKIVMPKKAAKVDRKWMEYLCTK